MRRQTGFALATFMALFLPAVPTLSWETIDPGSAGMDETSLWQARDYALTGGGSGCIIRGGKRVLSWGDQARRYDLKSTTKSIGVTVLGLALKDGLVNLDEKAQQYYPDIGIIPNAGDPRLADIRIWHLATHTAGFDKPGGFEPLLFDPGTAWSYTDGGANWLADCLTSVYRQDLKDLMFDRVFSKLGITDSDLTWRNNSYRPDTIEGVERREFGSGISANVDAMAKIGYLYLRRGKVADRQIIPESFVRTVGKPFPEIIGLPVRDSSQYPNASNHYGLLWWNNGDGTLNNVPRDAYWSWGLYDSLIVVIPSLDLVVARAGSGWRSGWNGNYDVLKPFLEPICQSIANGAPYPHSEILTSANWADASTIANQAAGSESWPMTWADDGEQYTAYGDGQGFEPNVPAKLSLGFARISGVPPGTGTNIRSPSGEQEGDGRSGKKASGMLMVEGVLYMWVHNANHDGEQSQLAWSSDHAVTWTWSSWKFAKLGCPCFLNFGRDYAGARDNYVYVYSPDTPNAYDETDTVILARVPRQSITIETAYEFFCGFDADDNPAWSSDLEQRRSVFTFPGGCNRIDVTYNAPLKRYLLVTRSQGRAGGKDQFSIYDAAEPWGPWTTVFYTENWDVDPGQSAHIPGKWISANGKTCHLVFSSAGSFAVRELTLTTAATQIVPDFTLDGFVDFEDFCRVARGWRQSAIETDIAPAPSGDGVVDCLDLAAFVSYWLYDTRLIAHWNLDEAEGSIAHDSAGSYHGTLSGNPVWRPAHGRMSGALEFDGTDDYVSTPFVLNPALGPFSVFAWIRTGAPGQVILSQIDGADWLCADPSNGKLMTTLSRPPGGRIAPPPLISESVITDGAWHRVALTWDGANRTLYVDGAEVAKDTQPGLVGSEGGLYIGTGEAMLSGTYWSGLIDDIRIYDQAVRP